MAKLTIKKEDHLVGKGIEPGVYRVQIKEYDESLAKASAKNPGSQNFNFKAKILGGPMDGVPLNWTFNEAASISRAKAIDFFKALKFTVDSKDDVEITSDMFRKTIGCYLKVAVKNTIDGNNVYNNVEGFMPDNETAKV